MKQRWSALCAVLVTGVLLGCAEPLPPELTWLTGSWRWTSSCCGISGDQELPATPDALVLELRANGEYRVYERGAITSLADFEVTEGAQGFTVRFDGRVRYSDTYAVEQISDTRMILHSLQCDDCYGSVAFSRIP
jgi:hypothetical protein